MAVLFVVLVGGSIGLLFRDHFENDIRPHLVQYLEYIQNDIGMPPNRRRAAELAHRLNVVIHIVDTDGAWSSNGKELDYDKLEVEHRFLENGIEYSMARSASHEVFKARYGDTTLYYDFPNLRADRRGRAWIPILILLLVLLLLWFRVRTSQAV